jgi:hypothetical protein
MNSPLEDTVFNGFEEDLLFNAIRIRFSKPFAQDTHMPTTHAFGDPDYQRHNVQVLVVDENDVVATFMPGALRVDADDTITFLRKIPEQPSREPLPWPGGRFRLFLRGNDDQAHGHPALVDTTGLAFDGEPIAPANGVMSGDGTAGGDFTANFVVIIPN